MVEYDGRYLPLAYRSSYCVLLCRHEKHVSRYRAFEIVWFCPRPPHDNVKLANAFSWGLVKSAYSTQRREPRGIKCYSQASSCVGRTSSYRLAATRSIVIPKPRINGREVLSDLEWGQNWSMPSEALGSCHLSCCWCVLRTTKAQIGADTKRMPLFISHVSTCSSSGAAWFRYLTCLQQASNMIYGLVNQYDNRTPNRNSSQGFSRRSGKESRALFDVSCFDGGMPVLCLVSEEVSHVIYKKLKEIAVLSDSIPYVSALIGRTDR